MPLEDWPGTTLCQIADEWLRLTFAAPNAGDINIAKDNSWQTDFLKPVKEMMLSSRETAVNYSMPLGLHHIFAANHHYGPGPWYAPPGVRPDWTPPYYHQADTMGIGFDRTSSGSNAVSQYHQPLASQFENLNTCPEIYLLWFHHLPWSYKMRSGRTLWDELCFRYDQGVQQVREYQKIWDKSRDYVDQERFLRVHSKLKQQARDAQVWKDGCLLYFQQFSRRPIPYELERPVYDLSFLESVNPLYIIPSADGEKEIIPNHY